MTEARGLDLALVRPLIAAALAEDRGSGDVTSGSTLVPGTRGEAEIGGIRDRVGGCSISPRRPSREP